MNEGYAWPPRKEDLERLYLVEKLSAMKIAKVYGLSHRNPKVAESAILYNLKRNGIKRRDPAEHVRKVTERMVDEWVRRYQAGESLRTIAGKGVDPVTVWNHLKRRGLVLRGRVEAQIEAVTRHERKPFQGDSIEKAYLMGLRYGDFDAVRHGRAIRIRVSTTHPAMAELFESLFSSHGFVHRYPREASFTGYEWSLECDLDDSFKFLLRKPSASDIGSLGELEFRSFLAGFFDAEGSIFLHVKSSGPAPEVNITNTDLGLLDIVARRLNLVGIPSKVRLSKNNSSGNLFKSVRPLWRLDIWRFQSVRHFIGILPLRHPEKVKKGMLALRFVSPISNSQNLAPAQEWKALAAAIKKACAIFILDAKLSIVGTD